MRPSTHLKSRPTMALICTRTSPAASNHVKSTSANQIETRDFIFSFLSMQLNTHESHANSRDGQILVFFSSFRTHHTHFLTYTTPTDTWAHQLCLLTSLFARLFGEMGGTGRGVWFSAIAALGPLTHTRRERAILLPSKGLFAKQSVLAKAMYNGSDSATHPLLLQKITFTQLGMQLYW